MYTLPNSKDPCEMPHSLVHYVAFRQGLHCLPGQMRSSVKEKHFLFGNY